MLTWRSARLLALVAVGAALGTAVYEHGLRMVGLAPDISLSEASRLRAENQRLVAENGRLQASVDAIEGRLAIERAARDQMAADLLAARKEAGGLRNDLAFFEQLIPADPRMSQVSIRSADFEREGSSLRYRVLLMRAGQPTGEFRGRLQFSASGLQSGAGATVGLEPFRVAADAGADGGAPAPVPAADPLALRFRQYQRIEGTLDVPADLDVRSVAVRVVEGDTVRAERVVDLPVAANMPANTPGRGKDATAGLNAGAKTPSSPQEGHAAAKVPAHPGVEIERQ